MPRRILDRTSLDKIDNLGQISEFLVMPIDSMYEASLNPHVARINEQPRCHSLSEHCGSINWERESPKKCHKIVVDYCSEFTAGEAVRHNGNEVGYVKNKKYYERQEYF